MPYQPSVQDISGQLLAQGMQQRAQGISSGIQGLFQGLQQNQLMTNSSLAKFKGALAANPKLLTALTGPQDPNAPGAYTIQPDILKAFSEVQAGKTNVQNTALLAQFAETFNQAQANQQKLLLQAAQTANFEAQAAQRKQELDQLKRLGDIYANMEKEGAAQPSKSAPPVSTSSRYRRIDQQSPVTPESSLQRGTGEMSLLNSLARFSSPAEQPNAMQGASAFDFTPLPAASPAASSVPAAPTPSAPASATFPAVEAAPVYDVPAPPIPAWFKQSQAAALPAELNLSPEAKAIASQLRRQYEESQDPSLRTISATEDKEPRKRKSITLDAEGIRAILSNPRILVESFADLAGDPYQQGLRRERLDRMMREQEQLRALEQMMRSRRAR